MSEEKKNEPVSNISAKYQTNSTSSGPIELTIATVGSVDAGKSTLVGVLTKNELDDGKGKARQSIFNYPHEHVTGRTSSIGNVFIKEKDRIINFIDLCGHEAYLKTTVQGMSSYDPDFGIVCIGTNITNMTKEHIRLLIAMNIPFVFVLTKMDFMPLQIVEKNIKTLRRFASECQKQFFEIKNVEEINKTCIPGLSHMIPFIRLSSVTGVGLDLLRHLLQNVPRREHYLPPVFTIQNIYQVTGFGIICTGYAGVNIKKGQELFIGPFRGDVFEKTKVRSLHNDYREFVEEIPAGTRGCICIKWETDKRHWLRSGMILSPTLQPVCKRFRAHLKVFNGHHTTIKKNFCAFSNIGAIKAPIKFIDCPNVLRSGDDAEVVLEFMQHSNYVSPFTTIFIREGTLRCVAKFVESVDN